MRFENGTENSLALCDNELYRELALMDFRKNWSVNSKYNEIKFRYYKLIFNGCFLQRGYKNEDFNFLPVF